MNIELRHLELIYNIDQLGSLSKSATAMYITQPAASHLLRSLEDQLGVKIYHRINKRMVLTKSGHILLRAAKDILPKMIGYKRMLVNEFEGSQGKIRIATECHTSYAWLPRVMQSFQQSHPGIEVDIRVNATSNPIKYLSAGKIDLAIAIDPVKDNRFRSYDLFEDEVVLLVSSTHPLSSKNIILPEDFEDVNYLMYAEKFENNSVAHHVMIPKGIRPRRITKLQLTEAIIEMVQAGMGVAAMSKWLLHAYTNKDNLSFLRITKKGLFRRWAMLTLKDNDSEYLDAFIQHFQMGLRR